MISIIVPVYNSEKTLQRCIESLLLQTYTDIEILLVIDGPTDSSIDIARAYEKKDSRIKLIEKQNEGVSKARNTGLSFSKGEYIQFVDSDDYIDKSMCEKLIQSVDKVNAQMALCGFHHLFLNRDIIKVPSNGCYNLKEKTDLFLQLYESGFLNMPWNKLFKKELIQESFDETLSLGEDLLFNLNYMKQIDSIAVVGEPLYYYIQKNGQDTLSSKKREDKYEIAVKICEAAKESYFSLLKEAGQAEDVKLQAGYQIVHKRLILEFLDEIEGMAYDKTLTRRQKLNRIETYMKDTYIQNANKNIGKLQADYEVINYFFKRENNFIVYALIYIRKWCLAIFRSFHK